MLPFSFQGKEALNGMESDTISFILPRLEKLTSYKTNRKLAIECIFEYSALGSALNLSPEYFECKNK